VGVFAGHIHRWQTARLNDQNLFTVPGNQEGRRLDVSISQ